MAPNDSTGNRCADNFTNFGDEKWGRQEHQPHPNGAALHFFRDGRYTQASNCGTRKIAVSVKSTMKMRSRRGATNCSGDQIMVPKEVTQVEQNVAEDPRGIDSVSARRKALTHFRQFAIARVIPARSNAHRGSMTSECVMLRCR